MANTNKAVLTCYTTLELKARLVAFCEAESRTQTSAIVHFIKQGVERYEAQQIPPAAATRRNLIGDRSQ